MYNRFKKVLLLLPVAALFVVFPATIRAAQILALPEYGYGQGLLTSDLTATRTSSSSFDLSWVWNQEVQPLAYKVTVTDLTTSTVLQSFYSSVKYATVSGLSGTTGHRLHFEVEANGYVIEEVVE